MRRVNNFWTCNCVNTLQPICPGCWESACVRPIIFSVIFSATKFSVILHSSVSLSLSIKNKSIPLLCYCSVFHWADALSLLSRLCHSLPYPVMEKMCPAGSSHFWPASFFFFFLNLACININWNSNFITRASKRYKHLVSHLIQHRAVSHSKAVALQYILSEHPQTQAFFRPLSFLTESYFEVLSSWRRLCTVKWDLHIWWE